MSIVALFAEILVIHCQICVHSFASYGVVGVLGTFLILVLEGAKEGVGSVGTSLCGSQGELHVDSVVGLLTLAVLKL